MAVYRHSSRIEAPLPEVWEFYSTVDGLREVTPGFLFLRIESVVGPDGDPDPGVLAAGSRIRLSMRPFGVVPSRSWTSVIEEREEGDGTAHFIDVMAEGPFETWRHTHRFDAEGETTRMIDRVEYEFPGPAGAVSALGWPGLEAMFVYRHRRTRAILE